MRLGFQQNDNDSSIGQSLSGSFRKSASGSYHSKGLDGTSPGHGTEESFRKSFTGFQQNELESHSTQSFDESFRKPKAGVCKDSAGLTSHNKVVPVSKRAYKALKDCARNLVDSELFIQSLEDWILENALADSNHGEQYSFNSPFQLDELRQLDFALEGTFFQQLFRMPTSFYTSSDLKEEEYFALEDFLHTMADGLWRTFWHKSSPSPFHVSCARHPRSRLYSLDKAISKGKVAELCGAALVARDGNDMNTHWDQVIQFSLFKPDIMLGNKSGISLNALSEALFYGFHILVSRRLSKRCEFHDNSVIILVMDSRFGAVVKLTGDVRHIEPNLDNPYQAVADWMKIHSEVSVSTVDRIWNKLGNANWGDLGTLQLLLATFHSIVQFGGAPRKSIATVASDHSLRLQKRRIECHLLENHHSSQDYVTQGEREIVELEHEVNPAIMHQASHLMLHEGDIIHLQDQQQVEKSFQIHEPLIDEKSFCYSAISLENPTQLLTLYVGAHPSRLEPSWEDMSLWYQVQRQTKVLNIFRQAGITSKYLPEIVTSGKMLHPGSCMKQNPNEKCDHPLCGTPVLVTFPIGEPVSSIVSQDGPFSCEEAIRCCRDCLAALRSAKMANVQHGDICPENVVRVSDAQGSSSSFFYVPVSWGRAVLEERDSPAMNLFFSSSHALQHGKLCPSSDVESLIYLLYFLCGGNMQQQDSIESALQWRQRSWAKRHIQRHLGEVSAILKAFADYVDTLCGTPYPVDYDGWLKRLDKAVNESADKGKLVEEMAINMRIEDVAESSGISESGS